MTEPEPIGSEQLQALIPQVVAIARGAGAEIIKIYHQGFTVTDKEDRTPVTEADLAANLYIQTELAKLPYNLPILSEEVDIPFAKRQNWHNYWLIDPLDGTREFIDKNGEFGVNIALIQQNQPVLGVVFAPFLNKVYYASKGNGAFKIENGKVSKIKVRRAKLPWLICASRSHAGKSLQRFIKNIQQYQIVKMGSSLKSCLVAEGVADIYPRLGKTSEWDTGACQIIVQEAGGAMCDTSGKPLTYNLRETLLNPEFIVYGDASVDWLGFINGK